MFSYQEQGERTIDAGKRCAITASEWLPGWWVSYSPRNCINSAEGQWCHWVHLARQILADDLTARHMPEHHQPYPDPPDVYDGHHPDCRDCADDPTEDPTP